VRDEKDQTTPVKAKREKMYSVLAQGNQVIEFNVAGVTYQAMPGVPLQLTDAVVKHPDFSAQAGRFGITEV
jgi:hypothetical protein